MVGGQVSLSVPTTIPTARLRWSHIADGGPPAPLASPLCPPALAHQHRRSCWPFCMAVRGPLPRLSLAVAPYLRHIKCLLRTSSCTRHRHLSAVPLSPRCSARPPAWMDAARPVLIVLLRQRRLGRDGLCRAALSQASANRTRQQPPLDPGPPATHRGRRPMRPSPQPCPLPPLARRGRRQPIQTPRPARTAPGASRWPQRQIRSYARARLLS
jgi:hypothetical protein